MNKFSIGQTVWAFVIPGGNEGDWTLGSKGIAAIEFSITKIVLESGEEAVYSVRSLDTGAGYEALENHLFLTKEELLNSLRGL